MARLDLTKLRQELNDAEDAQSLYVLAKGILDDLERSYVEDDARAREAERVRTLATLRGPSFWLTETEALRMFEHISAGGKIEHEKGVCRRCRGEAWTVGRSHCFGHEHDTCSVCDGTRIDRHRVKVPGADRVECKCPDWWAEHQAVMKSSRTDFDGLNHHEECPKRTA